MLLICHIQVTLGSTGVFTLMCAFKVYSSVIISQQRPNEVGSLLTQVFCYNKKKILKPNSYSCCLTKTKTTCHPIKMFRKQLQF